MIILAFDIATNTGYAIFDTSKHESSIRAGSFKIKGDELEDMAASMGRRVVQLIKAHKPDLIAIERPIRNVMQHKKVGHDLVGEFQQTTINARTALMVNQLTGSLMGIVGAYNLSYLHVTEGAWRKHFLGYARKKGTPKNEMKKAARDRCQQLGITTKNFDESDAVGVAHFAAGSQFVKMLKAKAEQQEMQL